MKYLGYEIAAPGRQNLDDPFFLKNNMNFTKLFGTTRDSNFSNREYREIKLSVIIPNYNNGKLLQKNIKSLESLLNNSDVEVLVIDDCSTDNSVNILHDLQEQYKNLYWVSFSENSGVPTARNFGIYSSFGKYILFLDADDYLINTNEIMNMVNFSEEHNVDVLNSNPKIQHSETNIRDTLYFDDQYENIRVELINEISRMSFQALWLHGRLFKSMIIKANHLHFPNLTFFEDDKFMQDIYRVSKLIGYWDKSIYVYNRGQSNISITSNVHDTYIGKINLLSTRVAILDFNTRSDSEFFHSEVGKKIISRKIELNFFYKFLEDKNIGKEIETDEELQFLRFRIMQILNRVKDKEIFKYFIKQKRVDMANKLIESLY